MNKLLRYSVIITLVILLSGCIDPVGTYMNSGNVFVIQGDGTYLYTPSGQTIAQKGTWTQDGNIIQATNALGFTTVLTFEDENLLDDERFLWVKQ